jgi:hypothetical protein
VEAGTKKLIAQSRRNSAIKVGSSNLQLTRTTAEPTMSI